VYRPKLVSQTPKGRKHSQAKSSTPKPSTPEQRENDIRRGGGGGSCERELFSENSSNASNEIGIQHNSMQSYQNVLSLSGLCVLKEKQIGSNFSFSFKKKRVARQRVFLQQLLTTIERRMRSKSFTRKRRHEVDFRIEGFKNKELIYRIKKIRSLMRKERKMDELELIPYKRSSLNIDVLIDEETSRVWNLLMEEEGHDENDEMKRKYWENIRKIFQSKAEEFINTMHVILGMFLFLLFGSTFYPNIFYSF